MVTYAHKVQAVSSVTYPVGIKCDFCTQGASCVKRDISYWYPTVTYAHKVQAVSSVTCPVGIKQ
eukprot:1151986-Pelagomonas_calceolata.AAC.3